MSYRPMYKNSNGTVLDLPLDASTLDGKSATSSNTGNTLMLRDANGRSKVAAPSANDDIANKQYVDTAISNSSSTGPQGPQGPEGLGIWRTSQSYSGSTASISLSSSYISVPSGRSIKVGDLIIEGSSSSYLYRVNSISGSTASCSRLQSLRGAQGQQGQQGPAGNANLYVHQTQLSLSNGHDIYVITYTSESVSLNDIYDFYDYLLSYGILFLPCVEEINYGVSVRSAALALYYGYYELYVYTSDGNSYYITDFNNFTDNVYEIM